VLGTFGTQFFALLAAMPVIRRPAAVAKAAAKAEAKAEAKAVGKGALDKGLDKGKGKGKGALDKGKGALDKGKGKGKGALDKGKGALDKGKGKDIDMDTDEQGRWVELQGYLRRACMILLDDEDRMSKGKDKGKGKDDHTMSMGKGKDMGAEPELMHITIHNGDGHRDDLQMQLDSSTTVREVKAMITKEWGSGGFGWIRHDGDGLRALWTAPRSTAI
jgi:hypothetical protein